jgi:hypothetical protein
MKTRFLARALGLVALLGSCSVDRPAPLGLDVPPEAEIVDHAVWAKPLLRDKPFAEDAVQSFSVGTGGSALEVASAGLRINVPAGAVSEPTTIVVRVIAGDLVAYDFAPHGMTFAKPIEIQQNLKGTNWYKLDRHARVEAAYFADVGQLDFRAKQAQVNEFLPAAVQVRTARIQFAVTHFSGYLVSSGRADRDDP